MVAGLQQRRDPRRRYVGQVGEHDVDLSEQRRGQRVEQVADVDDPGAEQLDFAAAAAAVSTSVACRGRR
ncbi:MAG: hypothetical protein U0S36_12180 [Candidatus Nanopelagicales bacterium]